MSKKLKNQTRKVKINGDVAIKSVGESCAQYPTFSFFHLTTNKTYNFDFFGNNQKNESSKTHQNCLSRLIEISKKTWKEWLQESKKFGCETLDYSRININPMGINLVNDEKIYIFRFKTADNKDNGRILGFKKDKCPIYYIIGFDFNLSAYDHGS